MAFIGCGGSTPPFRTPPLSGVETPDRSQPRRHRLFLLVAGALLLVAGCRAKTPVEAFNELAEAAERGDQEAFLAAMTRDSQDLVDGILAVGARRGRLHLGDFARRARAEQALIQGDLARVEVRVEGGEVGYVVMRLEDGAWRFDMMATEIMWNRDWLMSGGAPAPGMLP